MTEPAPPSTPSQQFPAPQVEVKYGALRTISTLLIILALITGFIGGVASLFALIDSFAMGLGYGLATVVAVITCVASSESIHVGLDIEENTRIIAQQSLHRQNNSTTANSQNVPSLDQIHAHQPSP